MSNRITKSEATQVAKLMVNDTIDKKRVVLKDKMSALILPVVLSSIPNEVNETFIKFPNYFQTAKQVNAVLNGGGSENVELSVRFPSTNEWCPAIETPKEIYSEILKLSNQRSKLREKSDQIKNNIYETLVSLATYKKIKEQFPEAYKYIPTEWLSESFTTLALPIEELTKELEKYK